MGMGFKLYLSVVEEELAFLVGANEGVSSSRPARSEVLVGTDGVGKDLGAPGEVCGIPWPRKPLKTASPDP